MGAVVINYQNSITALFSSDLVVIVQYNMDGSNLDFFGFSHCGVGFVGGSLEQRAQLYAAESPSTFRETWTQDKPFDTETQMS